MHAAFQAPETRAFAAIAELCCSRTFASSRWIEAAAVPHPMPDRRLPAADIPCSGRANRQT